MLQVILSFNLYSHPRCHKEKVPRMKVSSISPSVLTKFFIAGTNNATGVCFREYLWRENIIPFMHRQGESGFCTFIRVKYAVHSPQSVFYTDRFVGVGGEGKGVGAVVAVAVEVEVVVSVAVVVLVVGMRRIVMPTKQVNYRILTMVFPRFRVNRSP